MKVPKFKNLKEERAFWDTHDTTDYLDDFEVAEDVVFVRPKKEVISLRLDPNIVRKLRELADKEDLPPTTYARMLIVKGIRERTFLNARRVKVIPENLFLFIGPERHVIQCRVLYAPRAGHFLLSKRRLTKTLMKKLR